MSACGGLAPSLWAWSAVALATANTLVWSYNLFVFLLLRVVPQYLDEEKFGDSLFDDAPPDINI